MVSLTVSGQKFRVDSLDGEGPSKTIMVDGKPVRVEILKELGRNPLYLVVRAGTRTLHVTVRERDQRDLYAISLNGKPFLAALELFEDLHATRDKAPAQEGPVVVSAPMAGRIASLKTNVGTVAEEGQALVVLEAMKMENEVASPKKGLVKEIYVQPGALVKPGDRLVLVD